MLLTVSRGNKGGLEKVSAAECKKEQEKGRRHNPPNNYHSVTHGPKRLATNI